MRRHPLGSSGARQHGRIICFTVVGNQARLGAIRTRTAAETNDATWTGSSLEDIGEGKGSPRDLIAPRVRNTGGQVPGDE
ncbi:MAG TPA: hypothetical protein VLA43_13605 [Longimicrobiales bacterium]|nr:hypothetical protein [Longimicrobiales bacterium]